VVQATAQQGPPWTHIASRSRAPRSGCSGTTARGRTFTRTNDKTIDWTVGQPCITVSGESDGTILGVELKTTIVSFSRCAAECPQSGSEITVEDVKNGTTIDIKYSGGPAAVLTVGSSTADISLACGD
jgi:hypothetical protein